MSRQAIIASLNNKLAGCEVSVKYNKVLVDGKPAIKCSTNTTDEMLGRLLANCDKLLHCPSCKGRCKVSLDCGPSFRSICTCGVEGVMAAIPVNSTISWKKDYGEGYMVDVAKFGDKATIALFRNRTPVWHHNSMDFELALKELGRLTKKT